MPFPLPPRRNSIPAAIAVSKKIALNSGTERTFDTALTKEHVETYRLCDCNFDRIAAADCSNADPAVSLPGHYPESDTITQERKREKEMIKKICSAFVTLVTYVVRYRYTVCLEHFLVVLESLELHDAGPLGNASDFGVIILQ